MQGLGYKRYGAQGGDFGASVTTYMALGEPAPLLGIHLHMIDDTPYTSGRPLSAPEREYREAVADWDAVERGYSLIQSTRPQTVAYGLNDSPAGLAAWIVEKFRAWSDCGGDVERSFTQDELLTNVTIYWVTQTRNSSMRLYYESRHNLTALGQGERVEGPCAIALFPKDIDQPPREWAERTYNVQRWTTMPRGGHFAALEEPELLVEDIRAFFRPLW